MVGGDGGGRGREAVHMPWLLQIFYKSGAGWEWVGGVVFEDTPRLLNFLVMVGGDGGGRGRATVQMPRLLQFYYKVGAGGVWATVEVRRLLKFG